MLRGTTDEREGALLRRLKEVGHGGKPGSFGFMTGTEGGARRRAMVVVARVPSGPRLAVEAQEAVEAGADGIEIDLRRDHARGMAGAMAGVQRPYGVYIDGNVSDPAGLDGLAGLDWIHAAPGAPARLLGGKGPTRLISVSPDAPSGRLPGLAGLKTDVVVVEGPGTESLTIDLLLASRTIQAATKGPILAGSSLGITPDDVEVLYDHGVEGVLLTGGTGEVRAFIAAIDTL